MSQVPCPLTLTHVGPDGGCCPLLPLSQGSRAQWPSETGAAHAPNIPLAWLLSLCRHRNCSQVKYILPRQGFLQRCLKKQFTNTETMGRGGVSRLDRNHMKEAVYGRGARFELDCGEGGAGTGASAVCLTMAGRAAGALGEPCLPACDS